MAVNRYKGGLTEETYTPTGSWTSNTTYQGRALYDPASGYMKLLYKLSLAGTPTSTSLTVNMPSGWEIDTSRMFLGSSNTVDFAVLPGSHGAIFDGNSTKRVLISAAYGGDRSKIHVLRHSDSTRVCLFAQRASVLSIAHNTEVPVSGMTGVVDSHSVFDGQTFTVPRTARYMATGYTDSATTGGWAGSEEWTIRVQVDGTTVRQFRTVCHASHTTVVSAHFSLGLDLTEDEQVEIIQFQNSGAALNLAVAVFNLVEVPSQIDGLLVSVTDSTPITWASGDTIVFGCDIPVLRA